MKTEPYSYTFLCIVISILALQLINSPHAAAATPPPQEGNSSTSCDTTCGGVPIPFPFGIGRKEYYLNTWYEVVCKTSGSSGTSAPFLSRLDREVVNISLPDPNDSWPDQYGPYGVVHIKGPVTSLGCTSQVSKNSSQVLNVTGRGSPYFLTDKNRLVAVGRGTKASLRDIESEILGCESSYEESKRSQQVITNSICNGYKCCQARIPSEHHPQVIGFSIESSSNGTGCSVAFLTSDRYSPLNVKEPEQFHSDGYAVVQLGWFFEFNASDSRSSNFLGCLNFTNGGGSYTVDTSCFCSNGYFSGMSYSNCYCASGYIGNPYTQSGCTDDDSCRGRPHLCKEGYSCENAPGVGYMCKLDPNQPKIIKPDKTPVLQGILIGLLGLLFIVGTFGLYKYIRKRRRIIHSSVTRSSSNVMEVYS